MITLKLFFFEFPDTSHYISYIHFDVVCVVVWLPQPQTEKTITADNAVNYPLPRFQGVVRVLWVFTFFSVFIVEDLAAVFVPITELFLTWGLHWLFNVFVFDSVAFAVGIFREVNVVCHVWMNVSDKGTIGPRAKLRIDGISNLQQQ